MLQFYVRLGRCDRAQRVQRTGDAVINLFEWTRMRDRHFPTDVPLNSDARLHLALCRKRRRFYAHIQSRTVAFDAQRQRLVRMFLDVLEERDRIVDGRIVESANNVAWAQTSRSGG